MIYNWCYNDLYMFMMHYNNNYKQIIMMYYNVLEEFKHHNVSLKYYNYHSCNTLQSSHERIIITIIILHNMIISSYVKQWLYKGV